MSNADHRNTAYEHNTRAESPRRRMLGNPAEWHPRVAELFARDHAFLGFGYETGVLFRGLSRGLSATLQSGRWQPNDDDSHVGALERDLGVYLLSHELSDALAVSRLWQSSADAGVMVFPAERFASANRLGQAAMLAFAEPGVVFKYPFMVDPLPVDAICLLLLPADAGEPSVSHRARVPADIAGDRAAVEAWAGTVLAQRGMVPAQPVPTRRFPCG